MRTDEQLFAAMSALLGVPKAQLLQSLIQKGGLDLAEATSSDSEKLRQFVDKCKAELAKIAN